MGIIDPVVIFMPIFGMMPIYANPKMGKVSPLEIKDRYKKTNTDLW
jgi:hypothetical protein